MSSFSDCGALPDKSGSPLAPSAMLLSPGSFPTAGNTASIIIKEKKKDKKVKKKKNGGHNFLESQAKRG